MTGILLRRPDEFYNTLGTQVTMGVLFAFQRNIIAWCAKNLGLVWRRKLTAKLNADYFQAMNYYFMANSKEVNDPDERMNVISLFALN